ncbi:uncharacterized protein LODBEIA_P32860 [Lodderomyces beijingensis]|uniref:Uncharacterized protein n=1 Tax=Lodderomyces beijingensis TaxID=1775926 RepID=A0ABP0ZS14_9ASCO
MSQPNVYDSISLASTIKPGNSPLHKANEPANFKHEKLFADDLDPEEFISGTKSDIATIDHKINATATKVKNEGSYPNLINTSDVNLLGKSYSPFPESRHSWASDSRDLHSGGDQTYKEPIAYLLGKIDLLSKRLTSKALLHKEMLHSGQPGIAEMRLSVQSDYQQLSECHVSLHELYTKQMNYTNETELLFAKWESKRERLLQNVFDILSKDSEHGGKLASLISKSRDIDDQMVELHAKLAALKQKKEVIAREIEDTQSTLQSRTAMFIERFRDLEEKGKRISHQYLEECGTRERDVPALLKVEIVDVSLQRLSGTDFLLNDDVENNKQQQKLQQQSQSGVSNAQGQNVGGAWVIDHNNQDLSGKSPRDLPVPKQNSIGIQPYIAPDKVDQKEMNHGHGPTPYDLGYLKGAKNSSQFKHRIQNFIKNIQSRVPDSRSKLGPNTPRDDDGDRCLEKLDINLIKDHLERQKAALHDQIRLSSAMATEYHQCATRWERIRQIVSQHEDQLEAVLSSRGKSEDTKPLVGVLSSAVDLLSSEKDIVSRAHREESSDIAGVHTSVILMLVNNEINAIKAGLKIIGDLTKRK